MSKKYFISDGASFFSFFSSQKPIAPNYQKVVEISEALWGEDDRWLQIENIEIETGVFKDVVTVNQLVKDQVIQQDLDDQLAKEAIKQAEEDAKALLKAKADKTKNRKIDSLVDIKAELQNIYDILDYLTSKL